MSNNSPCPFCGEAENVVVGTDDSDIGFTQHCNVCDDIPDTFEEPEIGDGENEETHCHLCDEDNKIEDKKCFTCGGSGLLDA